MKYDFSIASILELPPKTQVFPKPSCCKTNGKAMYDYKSTHSGSFDLTSILSSPSTATAVNSSSISSSSSSIDDFRALSLSQLESESNKQVLFEDSLTHPSSRPDSSSLLSSVSQVGTNFVPPVSFGTSISPHLPHYSLPLLHNNIGLHSSDRLSLCHYLLSNTLFNTINNFTNASAVNPTGNASQYINNDVMNDVDKKDNNIAFSTVSDEVNDEKASKDKRPQWKCEECGKTYKSAASLRTHRQIHSPPWKCRICSKTFTRKWLLQGHERTHTGEKPFVCPTCQHAFADRSNLRVHMQIHMDVKRWRCPHCTSSFIRHSFLTRHLAKCPFAPFATAAATSDIPTTSTVNKAYDVGTNEETKC